MNESVNFSAYGDESGTFTERFQAIAIVSGCDSSLAELKGQLQGILEKMAVSEVKFSLLRTHLPLIQAANMFTQCLVEEFARKMRVRVDVLVWDTQDSRHAIQGRDEVANLGRMYYKLFVHLAKQWNRNEWSFYPDENSQIDWGQLAHVLSNTSLTRNRRNPQLPLREDVVHPLIRIQNLEMQDSAAEPLIQLADVIAGMARFTRAEGENCVGWLDLWGRPDQLVLPNFMECAEDETTRAKQNRFHFVGQFKSLCDKCGMGVSLRDRKYLNTFNPVNPINFWNYQPQHEYDKAPTRTD